ncbi:hypothetical protein ON010_g9967 [Phytophthora cinnamomi]|nr:hypothetical protein ON010_g9967 [Phytophthora cinnamomi]
MFFIHYGLARRCIHSQSLNNRSSTTLEASQYTGDERKREPTPAGNGEARPERVPVPKELSEDPDPMDDAGEAGGGRAADADSDARAAAAGGEAMVGTHSSPGVARCYSGEGNAGSSEFLGDTPGRTGYFQSDWTERMRALEEV